MPRADPSRTPLALWEMDNFNPLLVHMKAVSKNIGCEFAGALLRPHRPALKGMMEMGRPVDDIFEAANEAGRQLVEDSKISAETLKVVNRTTQFHHSLKCWPMGPQ